MNTMGYYNSGYSHNTMIGLGIVVYTVYGMLNKNNCQYADGFWKFIPKCAIETACDIDVIILRK
jgi:hypothetical protein